MKLTEINGFDLARSVKAGCINLEHRRDQVDRLNVFPVPDGDTGTNMYLTLLSAVKEGEKRAGEKVGPVVKAISSGSLMGARGNSGVILSQIFRGLAKVLENKDRATAADIAAALTSGAATAYKAVMKPVEGTILTVVKDVAHACEAEAQNNEDIIAMLYVGIEKGYATLQKTPQMLPILKEAGVVDAGGQGLLFFLQGFMNGLAEENEIQLTEYEKPENTGRVIQQKEIILDFQYCTETLIRGTNLDPEDIKDHLSPLGDSMLVVGDEELVKVHIHSNHPGKVLESCLQFGSLTDVKINNMLEEVHENLLIQQEEETDTENIFSDAIGLVAVAIGDGIEEILKSLGVEKIVPGGQTMNPSTEDVLKACNQLPYSKIIILPNNSNIIMVANQVRDLCSKEVAVVSTKSVMQAITALVAFDPDGKLNEVTEAMEAAFQNVSYGEITRAVRDSNLNGVTIKDGDLIGLINGNIVSSGQEIRSLMEEIITQMLSDEQEIITLLYGEGVYEEEAEKMKEYLYVLFPDLEIEMHSGGQAHYDYLISVE